MAFLNVSSANISGDREEVITQRLYILDMELPSGLTVVKIGKASGRSSKKRAMQIAESIFDKFRCTPKLRIKRDREVPADKVFKLETMLHQFFADYQYKPGTKFDGSSECFCIPLDDAVQAYEAVIDGLVPDFTYTLPPQVVEEDELPF